MNITDINASEIMIGAITGLIVAEIWGFIKRKYAETRPIKKLKNIKAIKVLWFILAYILPLGTIAFLIMENKTEPTFKNIALFIILSVTFVFNILMQHISSIYKMIRKLSEFSSGISKNIIDIDKSIGRLNDNMNKK